MRYVLDLPVLVEALRPRPDPGVLAWLARTREAGFAVASLTLGELQAAVGLMPHGEGRTRMADWLGALKASLDGALLAFDARAAEAYAALRAREAALKADAGEGGPLAVQDALAAATAQAHGLILATRGAARFDRLGWVVVDPWRA